MRAMQLTVIIPAHNEEQRIGRMLDAYLPYFSRQYGAEAEFIVVVNGSTDGTERLVDGYRKDYPFLRLLVDPNPIGKGGAIMLGFREARGDWVGFVDADGSTPPEAFQELMDKVGDAGAIIASRWCKGAQISPPQSLDRRVASRIFNGITRLLFGLKLTDTQCGAKLMRREAVLAVLPRLGITRWAFDVDLLFQLRRAGTRIREIPTVWRDVEGSKVQVVRASTEMLLALTRLRLMYSPFRGLVPLYHRTLGPILHPAGAEGDQLLFHSLVLMVGSQVGNICNMLFQLAMVRMLSDVDYGVMAAMLGLLMGVGAPFAVLSGTATHFAARFMKARRPHLVRVLMTGMMRVLTVPAAVMLLALVFGHRALGAYFNLADPLPLYVVGVSAVMMVYGTVPGGILIGVQAFGWSMAIGNAASLLRFILGVVLVRAGAGAVGALTAQGVSVAAVITAGLIMCGRLIPRGEGAAGGAGGVVEGGGDDAVDVRATLRYMGGYMAAFTGYAVLSNADLILVKHYFDPTQAGAYAKAAMVARIVFFLPQPVAMALFPKVASGGETSYASGRMLLKAVLLMGVLMVGAGGFFLLFPGLMLRLVAGTEDPALVPVVRGMVLALTPLTLVSVLLSYELAQRRFAVALPLGLCAAGYLAVAGWMHETPLQIVAALGVAGTVALVFVVALLPWARMKASQETGGDS
jgi:O-antigen/teichoic acid export membrane protein